MTQLAAVAGSRSARLERSIHAQHRASDASRRLETIPGIGVIGATAIAATITDPTVFKSGREFAAWIGLVPRQNSTGGKERLGSHLEAGRSLSAHDCSSSARQPSSDTRARIPTSIPG